jgi:hypothetical protein
VLKGHLVSIKCITDHELVYNLKSNKKLLKILQNPDSKLTFASETSSQDADHEILSTQDAIQEHKKECLLDNSEYYDEEDEISAPVVIEPVLKKPRHKF